MPAQARTTLLICLACLACLLCLTANSAHAQISDELREALQPKDKRWQHYPPQVRDVMFSPAGKPWFELNTSYDEPTIEQIKRQVERAADPELAVGWVENVSLQMFDSRGRVWVQAHRYPEQDFLLCYDPASDQWLRRDPSEDVNGFGHEQMYENADGTIFINDSHGVHVLHDGAWSFTKLYKLPAPDGPRHIDPGGVSNVVEDEKGRVYAWSLSGMGGDTGSIGYFIWADGEWRRRMLRHTRAALKASDREYDGRDLKWRRHAVRAIVPLKNDRVFVSTYLGVCYVDTPFGDKPAKRTSPIRRRIESLLPHLKSPDWRTREQATLKLRVLGPAALPQAQKLVTHVTNPEARHRLQGVIRQWERRKKQQSDFQFPRVNGTVIKGAFMVGIDEQRNAWLRIGSVKKPGMTNPVRDQMWRLTPDGELEAPPENIQGFDFRKFAAAADGRVFLAGAYSQHGAYTVEGDRATRFTTKMQGGSTSGLIGLDRDGRLFMRQGGHLIAYNAKAPDKRRSLPVEIHAETDDDHVLALDSRDRVWAELPDKHGKLTLHVYDNGKWRANDPQPRRDKRNEVCYMTALQSGVLIMQLGDYGGRAYLFDGKRWYGHQSMRKLFEQHYEQIVDNVGKRRVGARFNVDEKDRIWLNDEPPFAVYDGKRWIEQNESNSPARYLHMHEELVGPMPDGVGMLAMDTGSGSDDHGKLTRLRLTDAGKFEGQSLELPAPLRLGKDYVARPGTRLDAHGRTWLISDDKVAGMVDRNGVHMIDDVGRPRFEDSQGGIWFVRDGLGFFPRNRRLILLDPDGRRASLANDYFDEDSMVREDAHGRIWVLTTRGLHQIAVHRNDDSLRLEQVALYQRNVPRRDSETIVFSRGNALWFYIYYTDQTYRLYEVQLPPPRDVDP